MSDTNIPSILSKLNPVDLDAGTVFSGKASGTRVRGYAQPSPFTPALNHDYAFHESANDAIVWFLSASEPLYVCGPTGCGKTSLLKQLAARLNYPVFDLTAHANLEFSDLVGHLSLENGNMVFEYGPLALAMKYGGLFLLNEIDVLSPDAASGLNGILEGAPLCIAENGGELIEQNLMFRFACTANTNGSGDETGLYQGTIRMNAAWLDRFVMCEVGYPASAVEESLLGKKFPSLPEPIVKGMVAFANEVRTQFVGEGCTGATPLDVTFSTRTLIRWADLTLKYGPLASRGIKPIDYALDRALGFRASKSTRAMLHELSQRIFPAIL